MLAEPQTWFESFFVEGRYEQVLAGIPAEQTAREVQFIVDALQLAAGSHILDLCCGVGRHTIALASQGYRMTGLDLNEQALAIAQQRADEAGVAIALLKRDMREIPFRSELDAVISIFSSFGYYETDEQDEQVLRSVAAALKTGGRFLIETANRERIFREFRPNEWQEEADGSLVLTTRDLDLLTGRSQVTDRIVHPDGRRSQRWHRFRFYSLSELARMLHAAGLAVVQTWGDFEGAPYSLTSRRMIVLAEKMHRQAV